MRSPSSASTGSEFCSSVAAVAVNADCSRRSLLPSPSAFTTLLDIFSLFRRVKLFGAEIELSENTRRKLQSATDEIAVALRDYNKRVAQEAARLVSRHQIERELAKFVDDEVFVRFGRESLGDTFRCTIHIPDPVQEGYLYQLLNYYPPQGGRPYRSFSDRYGIIGKVWRSEVPEIVGTLLRELPAHATQEQKIIRITRDWGNDQTRGGACTKEAFLYVLPARG